MPRVRLLTVMAGPAGCHDVGAIIDVDDDTAAALVAGRFAIDLDGATAPAPETAELPTPGAEAADLKGPARRRK
jgi:hypothetical protein